jgi:hypothetical protein
MAEDAIQLEDRFDIGDKIHRLGRSPAGQNKARRQSAERATLEQSHV